MRDRASRPLVTAGLLLLLLTSLVPCVIAGAPSQSELESDYVRLRAMNAVLRARLSLANETLPYLILDLPEREIRLELKGVSLTKVPVHKIALNRLAAEISGDTTRIAFCEVPFVLQQDHWYEAVPTMALKDSAAVMSRPDTTGALVQRIRTTPVLSLLHFERNLVVALDGHIPPESGTERWKAKLRELWRSMKDGTPENALRKRRNESVLIELEMDPAQVRSLAPNLTEGTKLVLLF
jgi:hypothetical protein